MQAAERGALWSLSPQARGGGGRSCVNAADRRAASEAAVLRLAADDVRVEQRRTRRQSQAGATIDARDGPDECFAFALRSRRWFHAPARARPRLAIRHI